MRSSELIEVRNRAVAARWYYWADIMRRRTDDVLAILSTQEFFLGERTLENIIGSQCMYLHRLAAAKATAADLSKEYPSFAWPLPASPPPKKRKHRPPERR